MSLSLKDQISQWLAEAVESVVPEYAGTLDLDRPKSVEHGDFSTNIALKLAKQLKRNPTELAQAIQNALSVNARVAKTQIAGAGFINVFLSAWAWTISVEEVLKTGAAYGSQPAKGLAVQIEFVSANPTGPLHVGHGRGAAYGASLANVLAAAGFDVTREYYVNDAGRQMDILALSTWLRYLELNGIHVPFPTNAYRGDYVKHMAHAIFDEHKDHYVHDPWKILDGIVVCPDDEQLATDDPEVKRQNETHLDGLIAAAKRLLGSDYPYFHGFALNEQLNDCREDLEEFGVSFDCWFSEKSLFDTGKIAQVIERLKTGGHLYEQDGALWFKATDFGDEKDRVVQRANGEFTYFASDIAYHANKFERSFDRIIDVWGADHHGYIPRVKAALAALALDREKLTVALVQFAVLYRDGQKVPMSTRSGEFVTLRELREEVGNDAARFYYVLRKSDQHLDFDLDLAKSQSNDNPVYYVQYAYARICSVLAEWGGETSSLGNADLPLLQSAHEKGLMQRLAEYPETIDSAARELAPHMIAYYLKDLAADFHTYYNAEKFLVEDELLKFARLSLILATRQVLENGLKLLGVSAPERM
ncbi:MAG: arginine--tRNA ligase [Thiobacillaceae bacterium]|jgi:arginyl-tRNA synthetase